MGSGLDKPEMYYSIAFLLTKVIACVGDGNRSLLIKNLSLIEIKLQKETSPLSHSSQEFCESDGVGILLNLIRKYIKDVEIVRICVSIFDCQKHSKLLAAKLIENWGIPLFEKLKFLYLHDEFIGITLPKTLEKIIEVGSFTAQTIINKEAHYFLLCKCCQLTVYQNQFSMSVAIQSDDSIKTEDRVNKVIQYIMWYNEIIQVQICCLDALIMYSRNVDSITYLNIHGRTFMDAIGFILKKYFKNFSIITRCFLLIAAVARKSEICGEEITNLKLHDLSVIIYNEFENDLQVKQLIVYMFDTCLPYSKSKIKIHSSIGCMDLLRSIATTHSITSGTAVIMPSAYDDSKTDFNGDGSGLIQRNTPEFSALSSAILPANSNQLVIPLNVAKFLRETAKEPYLTKSTTNQQVIKKTKKTQPRYGTATEVLAHGESGLIT